MTDPGHPIVFDDNATVDSKFGQRIQYFDRTTALNAMSLAAPTTMRPLNSWMAFRSYYARMFTDAQQKEISTYLTTLWQQDPFKAKWSILAKVYSIIRDCRGKALAPLDKFLEISCPAIGIIPIHDYLPKLNWVMNIQDDGSKTLIQTGTPDMATMEDQFKHTTMSESEIIALCINRGYMPAAKEVFRDMDDNGQRLMASLPQFNPTPAKVEFLQNVSKDPLGMAAKIFDLDRDHPYLELSFPSLIWTGRMTDIYNPADNTLTVGNGMDNEYYNTFDISNPAQTTEYLASLGYERPLIQLPPMERTESYALEDSF
ncbi:hypothetical protein V495_07886 [Pseudogymnoascus sp. VKM F-4514 (FW-929)]|nr:hypothetical protein V495_07886 [Pseudogymnoascus sp. VKM F-4514 (FW-929)]KFY56351.1 hypothetical protein V497_06355 [Pseudogymnoascus sp. VKM F-4516 (FW-969)]